MFAAYLDIENNIANSVRIVNNNAGTGDKDKILLHLQQNTGSAYGSGAYGSGYYGGGLLYDGKDLDDILKVIEVKYVLNSGEARRYIELGSLPPKLDQSIINVNKNVEDLRISLGR